MMLQFSSQSGYLYGNWYQVIHAASPVPEYQTVCSRTGTGVNGFVSCIWLSWSEGQARNSLMKASSSASHRTTHDMLACYCLLFFSAFIRP